MGTRQIGLHDVSHGRPPSRRRLLAPLRYLSIRNEEKSTYDVWAPMGAAIFAWVLYSIVAPKPQLFGDDGILRFARDLLIMGVPFMVGALAAVAMGAPGPHLDRRPVGAELYLDGELLTLRQFVCYLLGYLSFVGMVTLGAVVGAELLRPMILVWLHGIPLALSVTHAIGTLILCILLSCLVVTVFWGLYFLTEVVNRKSL